MRTEHSREYLTYVKTDAWQKKRLERLRIDGGRCCMCGKRVGAGDWETHHLHYRSLGHEDVMKDICTLCDNCHKLIHRYYDRPGGLQTANSYLGKPTRNK